MTDDPNPQQDQLLAMMEQMAPLVAAMSGVRAQFIDQGWQPGNAEQMVIAMFRNSGGGAS